MSQAETEGSLRRPLLLPETFDGKGDFDAWIHHFEDVADFNGWSDGDKLRWLKVRLTNKAHVALMRLPHVTLRSFATARTAFTACLYCRSLWMRSIQCDPDRFVSPVYTMKVSSLQSVKTT